MEPLQRIATFPSGGSNFEMPFSLLAKRAEEGDSYAQFKYGKILMDGDGISQDASRGRDYLRLAARNGSQEAKDELAKYGETSDTISDSISSTNLSQNDSSSTPEITASQPNSAKETNDGNVQECTEQPQIKATLKKPSAAPVFFDTAIQGEAFIRLKEKVEKEVPQLYSILNNVASQGREYSSFSYRQKNEIMFPEDVLVTEIAGKYKKKYGIDITFISGEPSELSSLIEGKLQDRTPRVEGILYAQKDAVHLTSIIVEITTESTINVLAMDSSAHFYYHNISATCHELKEKGVRITCTYSKPGGQADTDSCRTFALVRLRNALLDLKEKCNEKKSIFDHITLTKSTDNSPRTLPKGRFFVPAQWRFTDQIYESVIERDELLLNPRQLHSKQEEKKERPASIGDSRKKYRKKLDYECNVFITMDKPEDFDNWKQIDGVSYGYGVDKYPRQLVITWDATIARNTYLLEKGYSNAGQAYTLS